MVRFVGAIVQQVLRAVRAASLATAFVTIWSSVHASDYEIVSFQRSADSVLTEFWDINNAGVIVGDSCTGDCSLNLPFLYSNGTYSPVLLPSGATSGTAHGISEGGAVVGAFWADGTRFRGYITEGGTSIAFDVPGAIDTALRGISPDGRYISGYSTALVNGVENTTPFVFDRMLRELRQFTTDAGIAQGINAHGLLVGNLFGSGAGQGSGFVYDVNSGVLSTRSFSAVRRTNFRDINDSGLIAGFLTSRPDLGLPDSTFVGTANGSFVELSLPGALSMFAEGINNAGTVVGLYSDEGGNTYGFVATSIPEPGTYALMLMGLLLVRVVRRGWQA